MDLSLPGVIETVVVTVLKGVEQIQGTCGAFAPVREDCGGDSFAVQKKPRFR